MRRAGDPHVDCAHFSPSISARGHEGGTESITIDVEGTGADQHVRDLKGLLTVSGWETSSASSRTHRAAA